MVEVKCNNDTESQTCSKAGKPVFRTYVPSNLLGPGPAQKMLHPNKDVFVLKVAKVGANGIRRCKMELELVTPKGPERKLPARIDTRETQCDPEPPCTCCLKRKRKK